MFNIKKPFVCGWISNTTWEALSLKEKDYIIFIYLKKFSKKQIMRRLYIENRTSYWYLQKRVKAKLESDVVKYNALLLKGCKK